MNPLFGDLPFEKLMEIGVASHMNPRHYNSDTDETYNPMEHHLKTNLGPCANCRANIARVKAGEPMVHEWSLKILGDKRLARKPNGTWVEVNAVYEEIKK